MTNEQKSALHLKALCVEGGEGIEISGIDLIEQGDKVFVGVKGLATHALVNDRDPGLGATPLEEPYPCEERIDLAKGDLQKEFDKFNKAFALADPLVDREDEIDRFAEDHPKSIVPYVLGRKVYFQVKVQAGSETGAYGPKLYTNFMPMSKRSKVTKESLAKVKARKQKATADFNIDSNAGAEALFN